MGITITPRRINSDTYALEANGVRVDTVTIGVNRKGQTVWHLNSNRPVGDYSTPGNAALGLTVAMMDW